MYWDIKVELTRMKLEDQGVEKYLHNCKLLADQLKEIGKPIDDEDLITFAIAGLPREYEYFITANANDPSPISFDVFRNKLLFHESRVRKFFPAPSPAATTALQVSMQSEGRGGGCGQHQNNNRGGKLN
ncbi:hypothetical protein CDL15_Pgr012990 [Punica granatum]|uniref:Retrovirus-related Pol polyprotein from transposon TNT 1-94 n=1 Tax=Punica granatum TaxID=22663 RepID=A0A218XFP5_PUNGR|nr:hypothetical protein CDL15_Pgr012990 [Punica granatum]